MVNLESLTAFLDAEAAKANDEEGGIPWAVQHRPRKDAGPLDCDPDRTQRLEKLLRWRKHRESAFPASQHPIFPFLRNGFPHEFLERDGRVCRVQRNRGGCQRHFEVLVQQHRKARILPNREFLRDSWVYRVSEHWGEAEGAAWAIGFNPKNLDLGHTLGFSIWKASLGFIVAGCSR
jgi:hypothetical protein